MSRGNNKGVYLLVCLILILTAFVPAAASMSISSNSPLDPEIWYVGGSGWGNFTSIQSAINHASPGDLIIVFPGVYNQPLNLSKSLTLRGKDAATTIVDGLGTDHSLIVNTSHATIQDFSFRNGSWGDLFLIYANDSIIQGCRFFGGYTSTNYCSIRVFNTHNLQIKDCTSDKYQDGIVASFMDDSYIYSYKSTNTSWGIALGINATRNEIDHCFLTGDDSIFSQGIAIGESPYNTITDTTISHFTVGIFIYDKSIENTFKNCAITNCSSLEDGNAAIEIQTTGNLVEHCTIENNAGYGAYLLEDENTFTANTFRNNGYTYKHPAIYTFAHDLFYHNNFFSNYIQAWDLFSESNWSQDRQGNYWDDYRGHDLNHNFIGTRAYHLYNNSNKDTHPLMVPYNPDGPSVLLQRPTDARHPALYLAGLRLTRSKTTLLIGPQLIRVMAVNYDHTARITKVTFAVDGKTRFTAHLPPYLWIWIISKKLDHTHTLTVTAYDKLGRTGTDTLEVKKFL